MDSVPQERRLSNTSDRQIHRLWDRASIRSDKTILPGNASIFTVDSRHLEHDEGHEGSVIGDGGPEPEPEPGPETSNEPPAQLEQAGYGSHSGVVVESLMADYYRDLARVSITRAMKDSRWSQVGLDAAWYWAATLDVLALHLADDFLLARHRNCFDADFRQEIITAMDFFRGTLLKYKLRSFNWQRLEWRTRSIVTDLGYSHSVKKLEWSRIYGECKHYDFNP